MFCAAQKEIGLAKARLSQQEKALLSISTGGSAQTVSPQRVFTRPLVPTPELEGPGEDRCDSPNPLTPTPLLFPLTKEQNYSASIHTAILEYSSPAAVQISLFLKIPHTEVLLKTLLYYTPISLHCSSWSYPGRDTIKPFLRGYPHGNGNIVRRED